MRNAHTGGDGAEWKLIGSTIVQPAAPNRSIPVGFVADRPSEEEQEANAALMAAGPEMLRALTAVLRDPALGHLSAATQTAISDGLASARGKG